MRTAEDTGLDPEEIQRMKEYMKPFTIRDIDRFNEIMQAEKDGRLVVPPCKVGDIVWTNMSIVGDRYRAADRPHPVQVVFIGMGEDKCFFHGLYSNGRVFPFDFDNIGKTVFLAREEAEAALKKREEADSENEKVDQRPADPRGAAEDGRGAGVDSGS